MHSDNKRQMQINEQIIASWAGLNINYHNDEEEVLAICPECKEEVFESELKADSICDGCFIKSYVKGE